MQIELFPQGTISQKNYSLSGIFWKGYSRQKHFVFHSPPAPFKFDFFNNFGNSKDFNKALAKNQKN